MTDEHLRRSIRVISTVQYGIGFLLFVGGIILLIPVREFALHHAAIVAMMAGAVFLFVIAWSVRKYRPWARTASIVVSFVGMIAFPFGTIVCGPFLYVLAKGKHLFMKDLHRSATIPLPVPAPEPVEMRRDAA